MTKCTKGLVLSPVSPGQNHHQINFHLPSDWRAHSHLSRHVLLNFLSIVCHKDKSIDRLAGDNTGVFAGHKQRKIMYGACGNGKFNNTKVMMGCFYFFRWIWKMNLNLRNVQKIWAYNCQIHTFVHFFI